jgi:hypothetical protein
MLNVSYDELLAKLVLSWCDGWAKKPRKPTVKAYTAALQVFGDEAREWINRELKRAS